MRKAAHVQPQPAYQTGACAALCIKMHNTLAIAQANIL